MPEYGLIVISNNNLYGLINWKGQVILPCVLSDVYYSSSSGESKAYMEHDGVKYEIVKYLEENSNGSLERYTKDNDIFSEN